MTRRTKFARRRPSDSKTSHSHISKRQNRHSTKTSGGKWCRRELYITDFGWCNSSQEMAASQRCPYLTPIGDRRCTVQSATEQSKKEVSRAESDQIRWRMRRRSDRCAYPLRARDPIRGGLRPPATDGQQPRAGHCHRTRSPDRATAAVRAFPIRVTRRSTHHRKRKSWHRGHSIR